jgi:hypothetical protein
MIVFFLREALAELTATATMLDPALLRAVRSRYFSYALSDESYRVNADRDLKNDF